MAKTILLAEDYDDDAKMLQLSLESTGITNPVFRVSDGDEAIAYLKGEGKFSDREKFPFPGVVLIDLRMPRVDGFRVLEWLKRNPSQGKILPIVLSGHDEVYSVNIAYALGAVSFLVKPCHLQDLRNMTKAYGEFFTLNPKSSGLSSEEEAR